LTLRKHEGGETQVGTAVYRSGAGPVDLSVLLRTPSLWLGNEELVRFAPLELRHRNRRRQLPENIEWYRRIDLHVVTDEDRQAVEELLSKKELGLMDLHRVAILLEAKEPADGVLALTVLEHCLGLEDTNVTAVARRILRRARFSPHPEVLRRAFGILAFFEQPRLYRQMLDAFLAGPEQVLVPETIARLSERDLTPERIDAFMSEAEKRALRVETTSAVRATAKALLDFLSEYGCIHPSRYRELRGFLTRMSMDAVATEVGKHAARARRKLEQGFRIWLGAASRIAVDPETGLEYRWKDVVEFAEDVDGEARKRLLAAFMQTPLLREAVFLFSGGTTIRLEDILPNGVWVRCIGTEFGKSVYRVAVRTRLQDQFDLAVNLNRELSADEVEDEIDWLILCGESRKRGPLVESFGGYWPEHDLWTEEFISGETLDRALRRLSRQKANDERYLGFWPYAAWSAASAHVDLWHRTRKTLPSPKNVVVPMHDYHTGARLVSITGRRPFGSVYRLLVALEEELVRSVEKEHPRLAGLVGWDIVFSSVLEVVGEADGLDLLRDARGEIEAEGATAMGTALERFVGTVEKRGFLPMRLFFAAKRYRRWARINLDATILARAATHPEIYETYNLGLLQESYPEVRARFFQETVLREADRPLAEGLGDIVQKLRLRELVPDELSNAVADLRAQLKLDTEVDFFLTRLSYPHLRPEDEAVYVPAEVGGSQQSEMVVTLDDADGHPFRIRHALSPKEVGRLHGLFVTAKLPVQFRPDHRFLVAVNERGHLIGGLFYEVDPEGQTAHMDKIVVAERFQRKGVAGDILEELCNRLRTAGYRSLTTGFFRPQFFYRYGFTVERNYAGLVRSLQDNEKE
jgi:GNAT superfamily N-acetyltransferase